jgi:hypothetical protein
MPELSAYRCVFGSVSSPSSETTRMHEIIYLIGLIVVVMFVLGALGLR